MQYMEEFRTFTFSNLRYSQSKAKQFVDDLHSVGRHFAYIFDPCVFPSKSFGPFARAVDKNVLVTTGEGEYTKGLMWSLECTWIDFSAPNATDYWSNETATFFKSWVPADGLWIDMNEPSVFKQLNPAPKYVLDVIYLTNRPNPNGFDPDNPPYNPAPQVLHYMSLFMNSKHHETIHYNMHNIYGRKQSIATYVWL